MHLRKLLKHEIIIIGTEFWTGVLDFSMQPCSLYKIHKNVSIISSFPHCVSIFDNVATRSSPLKLWKRNLTLRKSPKLSWMPRLWILSRTVSVTPRHVLYLFSRQRIGQQRSHTPDGLQASNAQLNYKQHHKDWCYNLTQYPQPLTQSPNDKSSSLFSFTQRHKPHTLCYYILCAPKPDTKFCARNWSKNQSHLRKPPRKFSNILAWMPNLSGSERRRQTQHATHTH